MEALPSVIGAGTKWTCRFCMLFIVPFIAACGGGSSKSSPPINKVSSSNFTSDYQISSSRAIASSSASSQVDSITITGKITYDFVPHATRGLNYAATTSNPARGVQVELVDERNAVLASTTTDAEGYYQLNTPRNNPVKIRAKAQMLSSQSPRWNFRVTDNTNNDGIYAISGSLLPANEENNIRDLHAASGWTGYGYTEMRAAAPFAILDTIYAGVNRVHSSGNLVDFPPLNLRWSKKNKAADGELVLGEIGTTFFWSDAIYILGDENNDTDEYDRHVLLHEWAHYVEEKLSRSDNIGGDHSFDDKLDMRVAMSEGFANAFSALIIDDAGYRDSSGQLQGGGFSYDVSRKNNTVKGWYSEASIQSVIFNISRIAENKSLQTLGDIIRVITASDYVDHNGFISIYLFADRLRKTLPEYINPLDNLLIEQGIAIADEYGLGETNTGEFATAIPLYKSLRLNDMPERVCLGNEFGSYNKLGNAQYFKVDISIPGSYQFTAIENGSDSGDANPELQLYSAGSLIDIGESAEIDRESFSTPMSPGTYILELTDRRISDASVSTDLRACFDVRAQQVQ